MESIKVLSLVGEAEIHDLKKRELIKYVQKLRKFILKQNEKLVYQKNKISHLKEKLKALSIDGEPTSARKPDLPEEDKPDEKSDSEKADEKSFIEDIKSAAEAQSLKDGFIFEPTSGLYYDTSTGYYYNAEYGLYYDGSNGNYYSYDQTTKEFTFHSTVAVAHPPEDRGQPKRGKKRKKVRKLEGTKEKSDGEISSDDSYVECSSEEDHIYEDISKHYPPSLRLIVQQSGTEKVKVGTLFIVTCKGGTLGREAEHDVVIPDINVSKSHLKFAYDETDLCYKVYDLGSQNGTLLNGKRMSETKEQSIPMSIPHGSVIQISETKLLCHIHDGIATCGNCEPGLLMKVEKSDNYSTDSNVSHKSGLKILQKKYGLEKEKYSDAKKTDPGYNDRAEHRRVTVGSTNPNEKTATASVDESIPVTNKGFKMLSKLGWKKGQGLGKNSDNAIVEPIKVHGNSGTTGLGNTSLQAAGALKLDRKNELKTLIWRKTQQRYESTAKKAVNIFGDSDDEDEKAE